MTEPLQVGQFAIVDHEPVDRGPNAGVFHGRGPADDRAELYIVAEGTTPAGEAFAGHVVSAVGQAWSTYDISLTGSLRRLFTEAERNLTDWNARSIAQHRVSLGITAFARKGNQAVIAQGGPSVAFHLASGDIRTYAAEQEFARPLGATRGAEPQLSRVNFEPGDRILILSTAAIRELDDEIISGILALPAPQVLPELYRRLTQVRHLTVLLVTSDAVARPTMPSIETSDEVEFVIGAALENDQRTEPRARRHDSIYQPSLFIDDDEAEEAVEVARRQLSASSPREPILVDIPILAMERIEPLRRAAGDDTLSRLAAERRASANAAKVALENMSPLAAFYSTAAAATHPGRPAWRATAVQQQDASFESRPRRHPRRESFSRGLRPADTPPPLPTPELDDVPLVHELANELRSRNRLNSPIAETIAGESAASLASGGSLVRVRGNMGGRWKAGNGGRRRTSSSQQSPPTWVVVLAGIAILIGIVGYVTVPKLLNEDSNARYAGLIADARKEFTTSQVQQDPAEKRKALTQAQALLFEAKALPNAGPEAAQLVDQVAGAISIMDAVKTPASVTTIADLSQFGERPIAAIRLVVSEKQAFILDSATPQVVAITFASGDKKSIFGEDKDQRRGRPVAIAFTDASEAGGPGLLIADSNRTVFAYKDDGTVRAVPFAAPPNLQITDMTVFGRDLYVLDSVGHAVWKWSPSDGGFGQSPIKVLDSGELSQAQRLMVDKEIVTADTDGTLRRFTGQVSLRLEAAGIDKRLVAPEAPQPLTKNGDIAALDAPNNRIVVLRRDGTFDRQYRHKDFQSMSAFTVFKDTAYIFSAGQLRRIAW